VSASDPKLPLGAAPSLAFILQPLGLCLTTFVDVLWKNSIFISSTMKMSGTLKGRNCQTKPKHYGEATSQQRKWRPKAFETVASCSGIASSSAARTTGPLARSTLAM
jgi:hypothetical protein